MATNAASSVSGQSQAPVYIDDSFEREESMSVHQLEARDKAYFRDLMVQHVTTGTAGVPVVASASITAAQFLGGFLDLNGVDCTLPDADAVIKAVPHLHVGSVIRCRVVNLHASTQAALIKGANTTAIGVSGVTLPAAGQCLAVVEYIVKAIATTGTAYCAIVARPNIYTSTSVRSLAKVDTDTLAMADSGLALLLDSSAATVTVNIPAVATAKVGSSFFFVVTASSSNAINIALNGSDKFQGLGFTAADGKSITLAAPKVGDYIKVVGDGVDGFIIVEASGAWARQA